jgi:hypothetical protein
MPITPGEPPEYMRPKKEEARHEDGLPQIQAQKNPSLAKTKSKAQDFERIPCSLAREVSRGDLGFYEFSLICYVALSIDYRTGEFVTSLAGLGDVIEWPHSAEYLRQKLESARDKGWIDYMTRPGPRAKYVIRLGPTWLRALKKGTGFQRPILQTAERISNWEGGSELEINSNKSPRELPASVHQSSEETHSYPQLASLPTDADADSDSEADELDGSNGHVGNETSPRDDAA